MPFTLKNSDKNEMIAILSTWEQSFENRLKDLSKKAKMQKALSIARQMKDTLKSQRHAHLWIAEDSASNDPMAMMIVDDTDHKEKTIRFLLSNLKDPSKGSGLFLVQKLTEMVARTSSKIKTTSENAVGFWSKCPGFRPSPDNSGDYVHDPALPVAGAGLSSVSIFQEGQPSSKSGSKSRKLRR